MSVLSAFCSLPKSSVVNRSSNHAVPAFGVIGIGSPPGHLAVVKCSVPLRRDAARLAVHSNRRFQAIRAVSRVVEAQNARDVTVGQKRDSGCVTLAVDGTSNSQEALLWTLENVANPGDKVQLVHIVFDQRINTVGVGASDTGRVSVASLDAADIELQFAIQDFEGRLEGDARKMVENNFVPALKQSAYAHEISLPLRTGARSAASIGEAICSEAQTVGARVLVVASHGPGMQAEYGSVARYCCTHSPVPLLVLPADVMTKCSPPAPAVLAACRTIEELRAIVPWLMTNAARPGDKLTIAQLSEPGAVATNDDFVKEAAALEQTLGLQDVTVQRLEVPAGSTAAAGAVSLASELCCLSDQLRVRTVAMISYAGQGMLSEMRNGSVASQVSRQCKRPLALLQAGWSPAATSM